MRERGPKRGNSYKVQPEQKKGQSEACGQNASRKEGTSPSTIRKENETG